jgi:hypothetical protein
MTSQEVIFLDKMFKDLVIGEAFNPSYGTYIEKNRDLIENKDYFPGRDSIFYIKISETEAVWLYTGQIRSFDPGQVVKAERIKVTAI